MTDATYIYRLTHTGAGLLARNGTTVIAAERAQAISAYAAYFRVPAETVQIIAAADAGVEYNEHTGRRIK